MKKMYRFGLVGYAILILFLGCTSSPEVIKEKLKATGESDLRDILDELRTSGKQSVISANPHFVVHEFQFFHGDTARVFQANASLYFFYLDSLNLCQERKYRYRATSKIWDRYSVELKHIPSKYNGRSKH